MHYNPTNAPISSSDKNINLSTICFLEIRNLTSRRNQRVHQHRRVFQLRRKVVPPRHRNAVLLVFKRRGAH